MRYSKDQQELKSREIFGSEELTKKQSTLWSENEALEHTRELFAAVLKGIPQRVRMLDNSEILLSRSPNPERARRAHEFLARGGDAPDDDPTDNY